jgi:hypothetical protein
LRGHPMRANRVILKGTSGGVKDGGRLRDLPHLQHGPDLHPDAPHPPLAVPGATVPVQWRHAHQGGDRLTVQSLSSHTSQSVKTQR